jgi:hypothetical protein
VCKCVFGEIWLYKSEGEREAEGAFHLGVEHKKKPPPQRGIFCLG